MNQENNNRKKQIFFKEQNLFDNIYLNGFQKHVESIEDLFKAFKDNDSCLRCIDEGTTGGFHSAGSGILRNKKDVLESLKKAGVKKITSHEGCGAAALYAKENGLILKKSDDIGIEYAKELAKELNLPYEHILSSEMNRPSDIHIARVAYLDDTGLFDYSKVSLLPSGFTISCNIQDEKSFLSEMELSYKIAIGDHGFGNLINKDNPFIFIAVSENDTNLKYLKSKLNDIKSVLGDNIIVDGFILK